MNIEPDKFIQLAASNEIRVWKAISEELPPNVHVYWNALLDEWRWFDEDSDGDVGGVLHPPYQDGQKIVVSSDIHGDMDAIVIRVIPESRWLFYNTPPDKPYVWGIYLKKRWP